MKKNNTYLMTNSQLKKAKILKLVKYNVNKLSSTKVRRQTKR